ncbi:MAG: hypothetical protein PHW65_03265 [Dehalococcoidales bacterium]|nr:hypothetical protein [Dehalococcoidales bacterium]
MSGDEMPMNFNKVRISFDLSVKIEVAPVHAHEVLPELTKILSSVSELDRLSGKRAVYSNLKLDYIPVVEEEMPRGV